jgi:hypothetical protein
MAAPQELGEKASAGIAAGADEGNFHDDDLLWFLIGTKCRSLVQV